MNALEAIVELAVALFLVAGTWITARYTGQSAKAAAATTAEASMSVAQVTREDNFIKNLEFRLSRQDEEIARHVDDLARLRDRVGALEEARRTDHRMIDALRRYARTLRDYIEQRGHPVPDPPSGLDLDGD